MTEINTQINQIKKDNKVEEVKPEKKTAKDVKVIKLKGDNSTFSLINK